MIIKNPLTIIKKSGGGSTSSSALLELVGGTSEVNLTKEDLGDITQINECAFYGMTNLKSIEYPNNIKKIGDKAFMNSGLTGTVVVPYVLVQSVTGNNNLGDSAFEGCTGITKLIINAESVGGNKTEVRYFYGCTSLTEVEFGETCTTTTIGYRAFAKCTGLTTITLPSTVLRLLQNCFEGCTSLETINLPDGLTEISNYVFDGCSKLSNISLPGGMTSIGTYAFRNCGLTNIDIPNGVSKIKDYTFYGCKSLTSVNLPSALTQIAQQAFYNCSKLENITLPENVTSIGAQAFYGCSKLTEMTILATTPPTLSNKNAIPSATTTIRIPAGTLSTYQGATNWSSFASKFVELAE